jgi:hypothetical protein
MGWYKPGLNQQEFAQDKYACMSSSQMQYSQSTVQGTGGTYNGNSSTTCNAWGNTVNCNGNGGYSTPGTINGQANSGVTTNMPLFQACMQARGYVWTSQAAVNNYEAPMGGCTDYQVRSGNCSSRSW